MTGAPENRPTIGNLVALLGQLADTYSLDRDKIAQELGGPSELAALVRAMFDVERPASKAGRPDKSSRKWSIARDVQIARLVWGLEVEDAVDRVCVEWAGREGEHLAPDTVKRYYYAARKRWPEIAEQRISIADMFTLPPQ